MVKLALCLKIVGDKGGLVRRPESRFKELCFYLVDEGEGRQY